MFRKSISSSHSLIVIVIVKLFATSAFCIPLTKVKLQMFSVLRQKRFSIRTVNTYVGNAYLIKLPDATVTKLKKNKE